MGKPEYEPGYLKLFRKGKLSELTEKLEKRLTNCGLCPRNCHVNRKAGETGACGIGEKAAAASWNPHYGEEAPLVGRGGSGTIFMSGCNLSCIFCQNYTISHLGYGSEIRSEEIARIMLRLQRDGCENCNIVSPTHVLPQILKGLLSAIPQGFQLPLVYNSGGYDSAEILTLIDGIFDIYLPDFKYADKEIGLKLSGVPDYPETAEKALREMYRQSGPLELSPSGTAGRGVIVRHLVLPEDLADSYRVIDIISEISPWISVNIMDQYHPEYRASEYPGLLRRPAMREIQMLKTYAASRVTLLRR